MKSNVRNTRAICFAMMIFLGAIAHAESIVRFDGEPDNSKVRVDGSSTVHDWHVETRTINGHIDFKVNVPADATAQQLREAIVANPKADADVTITAKTLKSHDKDMDKKMYEALKVKDNPDIKYQLTKIELKEGATADQEEFKVKTVGKLTIAGETREKEIHMTLKVADPQHLQISGELWMKMSEFKIKRPEAMLGVIKAGDGINIQFDWHTTRAADQTKTQDKVVEKKELRKL